MTDKQIIIDGVNVACCVRLQDDELSCDLGGECKGYNCYYKQLKRKEQECEELRQYHNKCCIEFENEKQEFLEKYNQVSRDFYNGKYCNKENCSLLKAKEQECEELEKYLHQNFKEKDNLHLIIDRLLEASGYDTNTASAEDFEDVYENMRYEKQQLDRYKQTLTEIKEIAEPFCNACQEFEPEKSKNCINCTYCNYNKILQKISECEANNDR